MSNNNQAGKGDKPRPVNIDKYAKNFDDIDWSKHRKTIKNNLNKKNKNV